MTQFGSQQIAYMRRVTAKFLKDSCTIKRPNGSGSDEYGFDVPQFTSTTSACRVLPYKQDDNKGVVGVGEEGRAYFRLILPYDTDIQDGDSVLINNELYEVLQIEDEQTDATDKRARIGRLGNG